MAWLVRFLSHCDLPAGLGLQALCEADRASPKSRLAASDPRASRSHAK